MTTSMICAIALALAAVAVTSVTSASPREEIPDNRKLGTIFNSDYDGILITCSGKETTPQEYRQCVLEMLGLKMKVLAQCVGTPGGWCSRWRM